MTGWKKIKRKRAESVPYSFAWKEGSRLRGKLSPLTFGPIIVKYLKLYKQRLTAEQLLEESIPLDSLLHAAFNWDDASAAHQHRLTQSRHLLRSLDYVFDAPRGELKGRATTITERNMQQGKYFYSLLKPAEVLKNAEQECGHSIDLIVKQLEHLLNRCPQILQGCTHLRIAIEQMKTAVPKLEPEPAPKPRAKSKIKVKKNENSDLLVPPVGAGPPSDVQT